MRFLDLRLLLSAIETKGSVSTYKEERHVQRHHKVSLDQATIYCSFEQRMRMALIERTQCSQRATLGHATNYQISEIDHLADSDNTTHPNFFPGCVRYGNMIFRVSMGVAMW